MIFSGIQVSRRIIFSELKPLEPFRVKTWANEKPSFFVVVIDSTLSFFRRFFFLPDLTNTNGNFIDIQALSEKTAFFGLIIPTLLL